MNLKINVIYTNVLFLQITLIGDGLYDLGYQTGLVKPQPEMFGSRESPPPN